MKVTDIINKALGDTGTDCSQIKGGKDSLVCQLNMAYNDIINTIVSRVGEDYFYEEWTQNAKIYQDRGEYCLPPTGKNKKGLTKLSRLGVKYDECAKCYTFAQEVDIRDLECDWCHYLENQSPKCPIYYIAGDSVFIAPTWEAVGKETLDPNNRMIKIYGTYKPADLEWSSQSGDIDIPYQYQHILYWALMPFIYMQRGALEQAQYAEGMYKSRLEDMLSYMTDRDESYNTRRVIDHTYDVYFGDSYASPAARY